METDADPNNLDFELPAKYMHTFCMTFVNAALKTFTKSTQCMALLTTHHFPESTLFLRITYRTKTMRYGQIF